VTQDFNTEGGDLKGVEIGVQQPFTFLPAPFDGFGAILNYTYVKSDIRYVVAPNVNPALEVTTIEPLVNLSPSSWNATLYFENDRFSIRGTAAYRDDFLRLVPGGNGADVSGKFETLNVDLSASVTLNEMFDLTFEAINLTDEYDDRWQSRARQNSESYEHTGRQFFAGFRFKL
jgi:TonB-dependent receptor